MSITPRIESVMLFVGDACVFYVSLALTLFIRYGDFSRDVLEMHLVPFTILFLVWYAVYFIAGLYEKHTLILKHNIPGTILRAQIVNSAIAAAFFYLIPYFGIAPKTNLLIHLVVSFGLMLLWRRYVAEGVSVPKRESALLIGSGSEVRELMHEVNNNPRYGIKFISSIDISKVESLDFQEEILNRVYTESVSVIVADFKNEKVAPLLPNLYNLIFSHIRFIDMHRVYEDIFNRVPLSLLEYSWFLENISASPRRVYDILKRSMDIVISFVLGVVTLIVTPIVALCIWLDDRGTIFFTQNRIVKNNKTAPIYKFRTMHKNDEGHLVVSRVGRILRAFRIDELPQLWNVLRGDLSLIGPRPEMPDLVRHYEDEISYYNVRHLIKPGLSGWAQIYHEGHPHHDADVPETKMKLSYDLYYIKNRSFMLDIAIALKTFKTVITRAGR